MKLSFVPGLLSDVEIMRYLLDIKHARRAGFHNPCDFVTDYIATNAKLCLFWTARADSVRYCRSGYEQLVEPGAVLHEHCSRD